MPRIYNLFGESRSESSVSIEIAGESRLCVCVLLSTPSMYWVIERKRIKFPLFKVADSSVSFFSSAISVVNVARLIAAVMCQL